jgi:hypothetical protein
MQGNIHSAQDEGQPNSIPRYPTKNQWRTGDLRHRWPCDQTYVCGLSRLSTRVFFVTARPIGTSLWLELEVSRDDRPYWRSRQFKDQRGAINRVRTFLEARMSAESNLVPHIAHSIRASDLCPVVEEVLHLNLSIVVNSIPTPT